MSRILRCHGKEGAGGTSSEPTAKGKGPATCQRPRGLCAALRPPWIVTKRPPAAASGLTEARQPPHIPSAAVVLAIGGDVAGARPPE